MKYLQWLKKPAVLEIGIFFVFFVLFVLLNWRLFAVGSINQLFLYGDNLSTLNNLFYIFNNFNFLHPFETLIGQSGMLGSYPMAEPQNSIFYLPISVAFLFFKAFTLDAVGLYYELLILHTAHFLIGVFFIYRIGYRIFGLSRLLSFVSGIVYLGVGWNVAWFGTATLSYMVGILPLMFYVFFRYLQTKTSRAYIFFTLTLALFLYAGGIVNFFFYLLLNFSLLFTAAVFFQYKQFFLYKSKMEVAKQFILLFILAPILSLLIYSVQLFTTFQVSADVSHASSDYDYLAFFGLHFHDLIGLIIPKFGMLEFGYVANPRISIDFLIANSLYIGFIPLILLIFGVFAIKNKSITFFAFMLFMNLILSFGGAFFLYDITWFFPGNNLFRGHYKYLMFVGIYISFIVPIVLQHIQQKEFSSGAYNQFSKYIVKYIFSLIILAIICGSLAFAVKVLQKEGIDIPTLYNSIALTFSSYLWRMIFIGIISSLALKFFIEHPSSIAIVLLTVVLLIDTSVNFKYAMYNETTIHDLISTTFLKASQGKTVINDVDKYTQLYHIPEIIGADPFFQYSAIPNKYLVEYNGQLKSSPLGYRKEILRAAGIDGVLTNKIINDTDFELVSSSPVNKDNYTQLYLYNYDGDIHNDWGIDYTLSTKNIYYYTLHETRKAYFTTQYSETVNGDGVLDDMKKGRFVATKPILLVDKKDRGRPKQEEYVSNVTYVNNTSTYKKIDLNNKINKGIFFINIPYSSIWKAKINGVDARIYRTNYAFSSLKINRTNAVVEIYIDTTKYIAFLSISLFLTLFFIILLIFPRIRTQLSHNINI